MSTPTPTFVPTPTYIFTATVKLGGMYGPIPRLEGGVRVIEPITGGSISGPNFEATIDGGLAAPIIVNNPAKKNEDGTPLRQQYAIAYLYGKVSDGTPFYAEKTGLGIGGAQSARLQINIGGPHAHLQELFVVAQPKVNEARDTVIAECFSVPLPPV